MYFVYSIYNRKHDKIYVGQTVNLEKRISEHNDYGNKTHKFTKSFDGGWILIYKEGVVSRSDALVREKQLKSYRGRQFIKQFIPE